jgi:hypothetical protein
MTALSVPQLKKRVRYWQQRLEPLGLRHWDVIVEVVEDDELEHGDSSEAEVTPSLLYDTARIQFRRGHQEGVDGTRDIDSLIVHELLHLIFRDYESVIDMVIQELGVTAKELTEKRLDHEIEGIIERLARTILALHR